MKLILIASVVALGLSACATRSEPANGNGSLTSNIGTAASTTMEQTGDGLGEAAMSPLEDFNLRRQEIPPLLAAIESPYHLPKELDCWQIVFLIGELDKVLGADWDAPKPDDRLRTDQLSEAATDAALGAVSAGARSWIPFRGLVRRVTGAEAHARRYDNAFRKGAQRRAYLKGYGLAQGCDVPARPDFATLDPDQTLRDMDITQPAAAATSSPPSD
jgi:hypothetical protein